MKMIDIGVNLFDKQFKYKADNVVNNALSHDVGIIITGSSIGSSNLAVSYLKGRKNLYATVGVHPHAAKTFTAKTIDELRKLANHKNVVAIGECGLDYDRMFSPANDQRLCFEKQILLAEELNKPLFLHERKAENDFLQIMKQHREICKKSVVHCFTGSKEAAMRYLNLGCYIGITGWICDERRNQELIDAVKIIPIERMMLETDAPYLTPRNVKGLDRVNVPENIFYVAEKVAEIKKVDVDFIIEEIKRNTIDFFKLER